MVSKVESDVMSVLQVHPFEVLFGNRLETLPQVNEVYEVELACCEAGVMDDESLVRNGAYFARVGDTLTRHFLMCSGEPLRLADHSSSRLKSFFKQNQFKTGYATNGLFPYRGKFHPQMIKGILNVMGLQPGDTVVDPMMGSGTVLIEATTMGIDSYGFDASPFCVFMTQAKVDGLTVPLTSVRKALENSREVFDFFSSATKAQREGSKRQRDEGTLFAGLGQSDNGRRMSRNGRPGYLRTRKAHDFVLLAFLDAMGYAERSKRKSPFEQFESILERYLFVTEKFQVVMNGFEDEFGEPKAVAGDARKMDVIADESVQGVVFSPPYSFAIDYLENDQFHLNYLGIDSESLRQNMVGLRGRRKRDQYENYRADMQRVLGECARILEAGRFCTIVVGTNNNQISKILGVSPEEVTGINDMMVELGSTVGFRLARQIERQITGMANTMRTEYIVILQKTES